LENKTQRTLNTSKSPLLSTKTYFSSSWTVTPSLQTTLSCHLKATTSSISFSHNFHKPMGSLFSVARKVTLRMVTTSSDSLSSPHSTHSPSYLKDHPMTPKVFQASIVHIPPPELLAQSLLYSTRFKVFSPQVLFKTLSNINTHIHALKHNYS
jgi:hypothetical protein